MKRNKGITLIALIITIIVMVILAGIAISMTVGENGIIERGQKANTAMEQKNIEEIIQTSYYYDKDDTGKLEYDGTTKAIKNNLEAAGYTVNLSGDSFPITVTATGKTGEYTYKVNEKGSIKDINNISDELILSYILTNNDEILLIIKNGIDVEETAKIFIEKVLQTTFSSADEALLGLINKDSDKPFSNLDDAISSISTESVGYNVTKTDAFGIVSAWASDSVYVNGEEFDLLEKSFITKVNVENNVKISIEGKEATTTIPIINRVGSYVKYDDGYDSDLDGETDDELYMILYDDSVRGLQIVSLDVLEKFKFSYGNQVDEAIEDCSKLVPTLNTKCEQYINGNEFIKSARCVGSNPINPNTPNKANSERLKKFDEKYETNYNNMIDIYPDTNEDWDRLINLDIFIENKNYWLGTYDFSDSDTNIANGVEEVNFYIQMTSESEDVGSRRLPVIVFDLLNGIINISDAWREEEHYIRPVFTLKEDVEFSGVGTEESPYIVSNY